MKLRKLFFRGDGDVAQAPQPHTQPAVEAYPATGTAQGGPNRASSDSPLPDNVVALRPAVDADAQANMPEPTDSWPPVAAPRPMHRYHGLLDDPAIVEFLHRSYWAFGRRLGVRAQSRHALDLELYVLCSTFQNVLHQVISQRRSKLARTQHYRLETEGGDGALTAQLELAEANLAQEITQLEEQLTLTSKREGWVLQALDQLRLGFEQGVREHLEFHRIFG